MNRSSMGMATRSVAAGLAATMSTVAAVAHPGHAATPAFGFVEGLVHLLTEPDHLALLMLAVVIGVAAARACRARRDARRDASTRRH